MAPLIGALILYFLVYFDHPDGSTSWGYICYYILVKVDSPDGSTYWGLKYYNNLVNFDHPNLYSFNPALNLNQVYPRYISHEPNISLPK